MQRLITYVHTQRERGATAVVVAVCLLVLVGFGALAVDGGAVWWDRKQLQNGADAAALAIAQACAGDTASAECAGGPNPTADSFAKANKTDGNAAGQVINLQTTGADRHVTAEATSTRQTSLANVFGVASAPVRAEATATWAGSPSSMSTIPFAVSYCQFFWQNGFYTGMPTPGTPVQIYLKSKAKDYPGSATQFPCMNGGAPNEAAGGFGWLTPTVGLTCMTATTQGSWVSSNPGNSAPCSSTELIAALGTTAGKVVYLPVFDNANGTGANGQFHIDGFAALRIDAYCFQPSPQLNATCTGNTQHLRATFVGFGSLDDGGSPTGKNYGIVTVKLK